VNQGIFIDTSTIYLNSFFQIKLISIIKPFIISIASVLGLGLILSYRKKLLFTGIGYAFFINAFVLQYYPLVNALFTQTKFFTSLIDTQHKNLTLSST
jgi:hypothetical protein